MYTIIKVTVDCKVGIKIKMKTGDITYMLFY